MLHPLATPLPIASDVVESLGGLVAWRWQFRTSVCCTTNCGLDGERLPYAACARALSALDAAKWRSNYWRRGSSPVIPPIGYAGAGGRARYVGQMDLRVRR